MIHFHLKILRIIVELNIERFALVNQLNDRYRYHMNDRHQLIIVYVLLRLFQDVDWNFDIAVWIYNERLYRRDAYIDEQDLRHFDKKLEWIARTKKKEDLSVILSSEVLH